MVESSCSIALVCDASEVVGTGHVNRQLNLAIELLNQGLDPYILSHNLPDALIARAAQLGIPVISRLNSQASESLSLEIYERKPQVAVFDGYEFHRNTVNDVYQSGIYVVVIDDMGEHHESTAHLRINQNLYANDLEDVPNGKLLFGPRYALLNKEIVKCRYLDLKRQNENVFITTGGGDDQGVSESIRELCQVKKTWQVFSTGNLLNGKGLTPSEMGIKMRTATVGVTACGTTVLEALFLGLPIVGLILADNQHKVGVALNHKYGFPVVDFRTERNLESVLANIQELLNNQRLRETLSLRGQDLVDGFGAMRVAMEIVDLLGSEVRIPLVR